MEPRSSLHELDDDALVVAAGRGEREALRVLVERWGRRVHAFLRRALASSHDADDLSQETFLRLWRAAPRYRAEGRFAPWLFRIAGNLARQELRRRRLRGFFLGEAPAALEDVVESLPAPASFDPEAPLRADEIRRNLGAALARLPDRQRLAVLLRFYEEMSTAEIAVALGASVHAAESLLARGTRTLRRLLRPSGPDG